MAVSPGRPESLSSRRLAQITWTLIAMGVLARLVRYLLKFPLWPDEAFLAASLLDRGYLDLMRPLEYAQVCPIGFLWVQATVVKLLGFCEFTLRLFPLLCSLAGLFVFRHLAGRLFKGVAWMLAVGIFSVAYPGLRYAVEAKPYGCDLFVSLLLITMVVEWWYRGQDRRWMFCLIGFAPVALLLSYPAIFVAGGVSLAVAHAIWSERTRGRWTLWVVYNLVLVGSFAGVYGLTIVTQTASEISNMSDQWGHTFPPLTSPLKLLGFLAIAHTSELVAYPVGGARGASLLTAVCCGIALVFVWRRGHRFLFVLCLAPLALNFVAAAMHRYPYAGHVRFMLYMGPMVCLLAGLGMAVLLDRLTHPRTPRPIPVVVLAMLLLVIPVGSMARDFLHPFKQLDYQRSRDFARWLWFTEALDGELVCVRNDLGKDFAPGTFAEGASSLYLCNQRIYSARHANGELPQMDRVSRDWPLRCVLFRSPIIPFDEEAFDKWLDEMKTRYLLVSFARHSLPLHDRRTGDVWYTDRVELYEFVPKSADTLPTVAERNPFRRARALEANRRVR
ncbi:MAG: hypothetical protein ACC628_18435 [Pirellulaceae bacterium]